ncbi:MAG TPA: porin [Bacteroidota bacterium]|nr:porin [Bacteroidota bacterium]
MLLRMLSPSRWTGIVLLSASGALHMASAQSKDSSASQSPPVTIGGYVDSYFSYNFDRPKSRVNELRNFDVGEDQFVMSTAEVTVQKAAAPVGFRVDLDFGPANDIVQSGVSGSIADLRQAYITYVIPVGSGLTVDAGKFVTHCCFEVIPAKDNFNYSRSFLFAWSVPYYHVGARAAYAVSSTLTLNGYVYNGWNGIVVNSGKTFGFEAAYSPSSAWSFVANWLGGPALPDTVSKKFRNVAELIASFQATDRLTIAANAVYGQEDLQGSIALWKGVAGYLKYVLCDPSSIAIRGEIFSDPEGYMTLTPQDLKEVTFTYEYKPVASLILRGEYRYDWSNAVSFDSDTSPLARKNQATLALAAIIVF